MITIIFRLGSKVKEMAKKINVIKTKKRQELLGGAAS